MYICILFTSNIKYLTRKCFSVIITLLHVLITACCQIKANPTNLSSNYRAASAHFEIESTYHRIFQRFHLDCDQKQPLRLHQGQIMPEQSGCLL